MSNFILCPECKKYLGKYRLFIEAYDMCIKMMDENISSIDPGNLGISPSAEICKQISDLLDALNITNICCRTHCVTNADFYSFLNFKEQI